MFTNKTSFKRDFKRKINNLFGKSLEESSPGDRYAALASILRDELTDKWVNTNNSYLARGSRQVYYFSLEFLVGQFLESHLIYLGVRDICEQGLRELGMDLEEILEMEPEAGLGNGGLGRLAACFMDSLASMNYPGHGCGIRYRYGLFSQKIIDGYQMEMPDNWLRETNAWEIRKPDKSIDVHYGGHVCCRQTEDGNLQYWTEDTTVIRAVPYDTPLPGYKNNTVNTLRLWSAESTETQFDFHSFSRGEYTDAVASRYNAEAISEVLYPDDSNYKNRVLRLKQQYFLVSAGLGSIVRRFFKKSNADLRKLPDAVCIQINDTHPALCVPELMRLLLDNYGYSWDEAWDITTRTIAYTNHTIMPEALEKWPVDTMRELLPRVYMIIEEINRRFCAQLMEVYPDDPGRWGRMAVIGDGVVRMAHLAIVGSFSVNGVAAVHTELLKTQVLRDFYEFYPRKFNNKTNGITHRRWLLKANPPLSALLDELLGKSWAKDPLRLRYLEKHKDDDAVLQQLARIKLQNKQRLADYIHRTEGLTVDPGMLFDVQVKRIHGYKRQLMNVLHILHLYQTILDGGDIGVPRLFLMAGKAAPSYYFAKNVIKLACETAEAIRREPRCRGKLDMVFLHNYGIGTAEHIFPGADISEQISTASKEASGTSNMKFMMNGALTLGTDDGANIEIRENVGDENFFLFGLTVEEVLGYYVRKDYDATEVLREDPRLQAVFRLISGALNPRLPQDEFANILRHLTDYRDEFFVLKDFDSYAEAQMRVSAAYEDQTAWSRKSLMNIAMSGPFSSDNTIRQYAEQIWRLEPSQ